MQVVLQFSLEIVHVGSRNAWLGRINQFWAPGLGKRHLQLLAGSRQPGGDRLLGHAEGSRDLAVAVAVVVAQDQSCRLLGRKLLQSADQIRSLGERGWIGRRRRPAKAPDQFASLAQPMTPSIRDGDVDRDPVQPRLDRRVRAPRAPAPESAFESVLRAILGRCAIGQQADQGAEDPAVRVPVEPLEVRLRSGLVRLRRDRLFA